jgi:hypothetical protein
MFRVVKELANFLIGIIEFVLTFRFILKLLGATLLLGSMTPLNPCSNLSYLPFPRLPFKADMSWSSPLCLRFLPMLLPAI